MLYDFSLSPNSVLIASPLGTQDVIVTHSDVITRHGTTETHGRHVCYQLDDVVRSVRDGRAAVGRGRIFRRQMTSYE